MKNEEGIESLDNIRGHNCEYLLAPNNPGPASSKSSGFFNFFENEGMYE